LDRLSLLDALGLNRRLEHRGEIVIRFAHAALLVDVTFAWLADCRSQCPASVSEGWRRERDSNPRYPSGYSGFQDHRHRPLGHPSASKNSSDSAQFRQPQFRTRTPLTKPCFLAESAKSVFARTFRPPPCHSKCIATP